MYEILADTYNLTADEREVLSRLGMEAGAEDAGTEQWVVGVIGGDAIGTWETLAAKLNCIDDNDSLARFGVLYRTREHSEIVEQEEAIMCPHVGGCGRTMGPGQFPFWPTEVRCADCVKDSVRPSRSLEQQRIRGKQLSALLKMNGGQGMQVPHLADVIGRLITECGGTDAIVTEIGDLLKDTDLKPDARLKHYMTVLKLVDRCNEVQREQMSELDKYDPEQLGAFVTQLILQNATKEQAELILGSVKNLPQSEVALA